MDQEEKTLKEQERSARGCGTATRRSATEAAALLDERIAGRLSDGTTNKKNEGDFLKAKNKPQQASAASGNSAVKREPPSRASNNKSKGPPSSSSSHQTNSMEVPVAERANKSPTRDTSSRRAMPSSEDIFQQEGNHKGQKFASVPAASAGGVGQHNADIRVDVAAGLEAQQEHATGKSRRSKTSVTSAAETDRVKATGRGVSGSSPSTTSSRTGLSDLESDLLSKSSSLNRARDADQEVVTVPRRPVLGKEEEDPALKKMQQGGMHFNKKGSTGPSGIRVASPGAEAVRGLDERIAYKTGILAADDNHQSSKPESKNRAPPSPPVQEPVPVLDEARSKQEGAMEDSSPEKKASTAERLSKLAGLPPDEIGAVLEKVQGDHNENKFDFITGGDGPPEGYPYGDLEGGDDTANKLAVAVAVKEDEDDAFIPAAVQYDPDAKPPLYRNRRFRLYGLLACTLIVVMIAGVVGLLTQRKKEAPEEDKAPTAAPTRPGSDGILEQLELIVGSEVLNDPEGAHYRAKEWLIHEDPMQLSPEDSNLVQRYLLAVIYYKFHEEGEWLSCNAPTAVEPDDFCLYQKLINIFPREYRSIAWYRWLSGNHECSWAGLFCDEFFQLRTIDLSGQDISSTLPVELTYFPFLQGIGMAWNKVHGNLPTEYGEMPHLLNFELHYNQLTGTIPGEWARAKNLQLLNLAANEISGVLPVDFGSMSNLKGLFLFENILTGTFPTQLSQLSLLTYARFQRNFFTGTIPSEIGLLAPRELWSHRMPLEGPLPSEIGEMGEILDLRFLGTSINGTIPEEMWKLTKLFRLDLFNTQLSGTLSPSVAQLTDLVFLRLRDTEMTGTIPTEIADLTELNKVWFDGADFTGTVPDGLCDRPALDELIADCLPTPDGGEARVNCTCCHWCCDYSTGLCEEI